ncbi:MAG: DUF6913 domain-containing protein [Flavobacteriales bacterium]
MLFRGIRDRIGRLHLNREGEPMRQRGGTNFTEARRIGILYRDDDELSYHRIRSFAKSLKEQYHTPTIQVLGFVDLPEKQLPGWQQRKLEYDFFTHDDLNWYMKPVKNVRSFLDQDFDLLIDLSGGDVTPLAFVLKAARAGMKVGWQASVAAPFCDLTIALKGSRAPDQFMQQLRVYLGNSQIT